MSLGVHNNGLPGDRRVQSMEGSALGRVQGVEGSALRRVQSIVGSALGMVGSAVGRVKGAAVFAMPDFRRTINVFLCPPSV